MMKKRRRSRAGPGKTKGGAIARLEDSDSASFAVAGEFVNPNQRRTLLLDRLRGGQAGRSFINVPESGEVETVENERHRWYGR